MDQFEKRQPPRASEVPASDRLRFDILDRFRTEHIDGIREMLDGLLSAELSTEQTGAVIEAVERAYLEGGMKLQLLPPYLFRLYDRCGEEDLARFYLELCADTLEGDPAYSAYLDKYPLTPDVGSSAEYHEHNFTRDYTFGNDQKSYGVYSCFPGEIGRNMTLLKTPYGDVIFDCGAKMVGTDVLTITQEEFTGFLDECGSSVERIEAVIISHAHMDHYGSLPSVLAAGIPQGKIFMSPRTKDLIDAVAGNTISTKGVKAVGPFLILNGKIRIAAFPNGHIMGSEGHIVRFDDIIVVYTGDYCLHDQHTVKGLDPASILDHKLLKGRVVDCLITESTYGRRPPRRLDHKGAEAVLRHFVDRLVSMGYKVFLPAFAIGRSQELALILNGDLRTLISGMAVKVSDVYESYGIKIFIDNTRCSTQSVSKSSDWSANDAIIASSGMLAENSASADYLEHLLEWDEAAALIITGYMGSTEDRKSIRSLQQWKERGKLRLDISLSAHADHGELISLINTIHPRNIVAIHGEGIYHERTAVLGQEEQKRKALKK